MNPVVQASCSRPTRGRRSPGPGASSSSAPGQLESLVRAGAQGYGTWSHSEADHDASVDDGETPRPVFYRTHTGRVGVADEEEAELEFVEHGERAEDVHVAPLGRHLEESSFWEETDKLGSWREAERAKKKCPAVDLTSFGGFALYIGSLRSLTIKIALQSAPKVMVRRYKT
uniref:Uncharacterized protein n=1 Tax=Steinernema glaseri TaxID=37863 RepID=A0A1I7YNC2_9BILA